MPHGKMNPPHMHFTCEVFICVRGEWEIMWGFNPDHRSVRIGAGDIVSVPTWIYRGFRNVGIDDGFMFTALGGDDTGGILWGPTTLAAAAANGLHLTDDYRIIDERKGEKLVPPLKALEPMTDQEIAALRDWSEAEMLNRIVRGAGLRWSALGLLDSALPGGGARLAPVIGQGISEDRDATPPIANSHGVSIEWLSIPAGGSVARHRLADKQVVIAVEGDKRLFNQYGVILVNPAKHAHIKKDLAQAFIDWLVSGEGQRAIADYKIGGEQLFFPNAGQEGV